MSKITNYLKEFKLTLRSIPALTIVFFVIATIFMNIFGSRELISSEYLKLNDGIVFSWVGFACMDCVCKRFGKKAAFKMNVVATIIEVIVSIVFFVLMRVPGTWSAVFSAPNAESGTMINEAINSTFSGTWYIVLWSAIAMLSSGFLNIVLNMKIGEKVDDGSYKGFSIRSFVSTIIAQFVDNFIFSAAVSHVLFGWSWKYVIICSITSMLIEFLLEALVSPLTYHIAKTWERENVGREYLEYIKGE